MLFVIFINLENYIHGNIIVVAVVNAVVLLLLQWWMR